MVIARRLGLALALVAVAALVTALLFAPAKAAELAKGGNIISLQLTHGDADFVSPELGTGSISAFDHSEWGGQLQLQHMLSNTWALAVSYGIGTFKETNTYGDNALPGTPDGEYTQSSWNVRVGADRFVSLADDVHLFAGPGIEYWSGDAEYDFPPAYGPTAETGTTNRVSLTGRVGVHIGLSSSLALNGHFGCYIGSASADQAGAEASWMPSGNQGALGLALAF
jgi:hypothetical protein